MQKKWYWIIHVLSVVVLVFVILSVSLTMSNRSLKNNVNRRQYYINQSVNLNKLNNNIIRNLAQLAAKKNDLQLKQLLNDHGITFSIKAPVSETAEKGEK